MPPKTSSRSSCVSQTMLCLARFVAGALLDEAALASKLRKVNVGVEVGDACVGCAVAVTGTLDGDTFKVSVSDFSTIGDSCDGCGTWEIKLPVKVSVARYVLGLDPMFCVFTVTVNTSLCPLFKALSWSGETCSQLFSLVLASQEIACPLLLVIVIFCEAGCSTP